MLRAILLYSKAVLYSSIVAINNICRQNTYSNFENVAEWLNGAKKEVKSIISVFRAML